MAVKDIGETIAAIGKPLTAAAGFTLAILTEVLPIIPEQHKVLAQSIIGVLTVIVAYFAPYAPLPSVRRSAAKPAAKKARPARRSAERPRRRPKAVTKRVGGKHPKTTEEATESPKEPPKLESKPLAKPPGVWGGPSVDDE